MPEIFNVEAHHSITRANAAFDFGFGNLKLMAPVFRLGNNQNITRFKSTEDHDPIAANGSAFDVASNTLFTLPWSDGVSVYQVNEDKTFTHLINHPNPMNLEAQYSSIAIHPATKQLFLGSMYEAGLAVVDYTDPLNLVTTIETQSTLGIPLDEFGASHANCLHVAGDYLWLGGYDEGYITTGLFYRIYIPTMTVESIPIQNNKHQYRRVALFPDEANNRIFCMNPSGAYDCEIMVISDPDSASPTVQNIDIEAATGQNDYYTRGSGMWIDPTNPDHVWMTVNRYWCKLDLSTAGPTTGATLLQEKFTTAIGRPNEAASNVKGMRFEGYYEITNHPLDSGVMLICPRGGHPRHFGWFDHENERPVVTHRAEVNYNGNLPGDDTCYQHDYGWIKKYTTNGGNDFLILTGYGADAITASFEADGTAAFLYESAELEFGTWNMENNANIRMAQLSFTKNHDYWEPAGTSVAFYLSNDAGLTWVSHDPDTNTPTAFAGLGTDLRVKIVFTGTPTKSAYIQARAFVIIAYSSGTMPNKIHRTATRRIRGGN